MTTAAVTKSGVRSVDDNGQKPAPDRALIRRFLEELYVAAEDIAGAVVLYWPDAVGKPQDARFFDHHDLDAMADYAEKLAHDHDVYFQPNLIDPAKVDTIRNRNGRGDESEVIAVISFHGDIDAHKPGHTKNYPPRSRIDDTFRKMPFQPSIVVNSGPAGRGAHPYTLLVEPVVIDSEAMRTRVKGISERWQGLLRTHLGHDDAGRSYDIDSTFDLCRVLRPAGTINHKYGCVVTWDVFEPHRRYAWTDVEDNAPEISSNGDGRQAAAPQTEQASSKPTGYHPSDKEVLAALENHDEWSIIKRLKDGDESLWSGPDARYQSRSEADYALIGFLKYFTPDGDQIERLMRGAKLARPEWDTRRGSKTLLRFEIDKSLKTRTHFLDWDLPEKQAERGELPAIDAGCDDLPKVTREAWGALKKSNDPPRLFRFGGRIVRTETGDQAEVVLSDITVDRARFEMSESAFWFRTVNAGTKKDPVFDRKPASPTDKQVRNVLAKPDPDLPCLTRIVEAPVFAPDGSLVVVRKIVPFRFFAAGWGPEAGRRS
ncbi:MAG: hypothetical protein Q7R41_05140, partial [Phycisphaerales bacterium]|nr:hypothetical protein [Phycisphaerales bacterium]